MTPLTKAPVELAGALDFDLEHLVEGLRLKEDEVLDYFRDGRRAQPIVARRLLEALEVTKGWRCATPFGGGYRLVRDAGSLGDVQSFEVRSVVRELSFAPSFMKGTGRRFDEVAFSNHYDNIDGVFVADVAAFPRCPYWRVGSLRVIEWSKAGELGAKGSVKRADLPRLLEGFNP